MNKFKEWFASQDFYTNMRFVHGDALFDKDGDFFRILAVQIAWEAWQSRQAELDQQKLLTRDSELHLDAAKEEIERLKGVVDKALNLINNWWHPDVDQKLFIENVGKVLRGEDQYAEHRSKAEQQISNGAHLTTHKIDL